MKLFLIIGIIAILVAVILAMQRGGTRVTMIERRREREDDDREPRSR